MCFSLQCYIWIYCIKILNGKYFKNLPTFLRELHTIFKNLLKFQNSLLNKLYKSTLTSFNINVKNIKNKWKIFRLPRILHFELWLFIMNNNNHDLWDSMNHEVSIKHIEFKTFTKNIIYQFYVYKNIKFLYHYVVFWDCICFFYLSLMINRHAKSSSINVLENRLI